MKLYLDSSQYIILLQFSQSQFTANYMSRLKQFSNPKLMDMCIQNLKSQNINKIFKKLLVLCLINKKYNAIEGKKRN